MTGRLGGARRVLSLSARRHRAGAAAPSVGRAVARSVLAGVVAFVVLAIAGSHTLQRLATSEVVRGARERTQADARDVVEPALTQDVVDGEPAALARFDRVMRMRLLREPVVRMKLWTADGRIVYSDDPRYIGARFALRGPAADVLREGGTHADLIEPDDPEHRFDTGEARLLEVYERLRAADGSPLLFELYLRYSAVTADGSRIWRSFAPALVGALLLQQLLQVPLSLSLARRLRRGQEERERLLTRALRASDVERRRIARDLHDGAVQTMSGVAYTLEGISRRPDLPTQRAALEGAVTDTRQGLSELRSLLVEIYPPALTTAGLARALDDLARFLRARGVSATVTVDADLDLPEGQERLLYSVAQEAVRNAARHAQATAVRVTVARTADGTSLTVTDDGLGFDVGAAADRVEHFGLAMATELADESGGRLHVDGRRPGGGTTLRLDLP